MINNRTYINIIIRTLLIVATCVLLALSITSRKPVVILNHTALIVIQVVLLIKFLNKTNYEIARVFDSLKDRDFSVSLKGSGGSESQRKLYESLENVVQILKESQIDSITKSQELYAIIENVSTGLLWFTEDGNIQLINKATKDLLGLNSLENIKELDLINKDLSKNLRDIRPSEQKVLKLIVKNEPVQLAIKASIMVQREKKIKLVSLQNIKVEMDEAEMDSWQKLIRVLAHEIMNSIGPITTSTSAISKYFKEDDAAVSPEKIDQNIIDNTIKGLQIIEERSIGLKAFVGNYRQLSNLPEPKFEDVNLVELVNQILQLLLDDLKSINVLTEFGNENLAIQIDPKLISQVIINMILNAKQAVNHITNPEIKISVFKNDGRTQLIITDNGSGISDEILDKIFIPFFTTKEDGSGIGLSLSRQIVRKHGGNILVKSKQGKTSFVIEF